MASDLERVALSPQKQDPAWKHCQMFKYGDRVHLKCIYCGKIFKGGGIHRIKEHLAGFKGNAAICLRVEPDVRLQMLQSLNGTAVKKRKKPKVEEETEGFDDPGTSGLGVVNNGSGLNSEMDLLPLKEMIGQDTDWYANKEESEGKRTEGRKKKGRVRKGSDHVDDSNVDSLQDVDSKKMVHMAIGRFFVDVGLDMNAVNSDYFRPMIDVIASQGRGVVAPSYHDLRGWILKNSVNEVRNEVDRCRGSWGRTGCSILVKEWNSAKRKTFVNFFAYCREGTIFLRSADISKNVVDSAEVVYELLKETVEEVGLCNVVQVITSCKEPYLIAGTRLSETMPTVFWTPCAAHCIDLMLEDIGKLPKVKTILEQSKCISRYMYANSVLLNMMRRYTFEVELIDLGNTRASTDFMTLKRMVNLRHNLQSMITSEEWMQSPHAKKTEGFEVLDYITNQSFWSACESIARIIEPLLRLLRIVGNEKRPGMGYVYAGMYRAKEMIKKELVHREEYLVYWNVIDKRWEQLNRHPLHAAGFYFNPKFFYSLEGDSHLYIRSLVYDCIEKLVLDSEIQDKIMKETASYYGGFGDFGRKMAVRARDTMHPAEWWLTYGGGCPNLSRLAIRILSQTCSLTETKRNNALLEWLHERKNCLEQQRISDIVFAHYNMPVKHKVPGNKEPDAVDRISYENIHVVEEWLVDKEVISSEGQGNFDWMSVDPPLSNVMLLGTPVDDIEALGAGFNDYEIFEGVKNSEEEND